jgi:hypothetical protein
MHGSASSQRNATGDGLSSTKMRRVWKRLRGKPAGKIDPPPHLWGLAAPRLSSLVAKRARALLPLGARSCPRLGRA